MKDRNPVSGGMVFTLITLAVIGTAYVLLTGLGFGVEYLPAGRAAEAELLKTHTTPAKQSNRNPLALLEPTYEEAKAASEKQNARMEKYKKENARLEAEPVDPRVTDDIAQAIVLRHLSNPDEKARKVSRAWIEQTTGITSPGAQNAILEIAASYTEESNRIDARAKEIILSNASDKSQKINALNSEKSNLGKNKFASLLARLGVADFNKLKNGIRDKVKNTIKVKGQ